MIISSKNINVISVICLVLHAAPLLFFFWRNGPTTPLDAAQYLDLARNLLIDGTFGWYCNDIFAPESVRMPGYPALIAFFFSIFGERLWPIVIFQALLYLGAVVLIWRAGCRVFGRVTGTIFLMISATYPFVAFWAVNVMSEMCCVFLIAVSVFFLTKQGTVNLIVGSIPIVLATYFRPNIMFLGIFIGVCCLVASKFRERRMVVVLTLVTITGMVPWTLRNYVTFDVASPLPIVKGTGLSLFVSTWQGRVSTETLVAWGTDSKFTVEAIESGFYDQVEEIKGKVNSRLSGGDRVEVLSLLEKCDSNEKRAAIEAEMRNAAIENIGNYPSQFLLGAGANIFRMWVTTFGLRDLPPIVQYLLIAQGLIIVILGYFGILLLLWNFKSKGPGEIVFVAVILYFVVTLLFLHTEARYTIPTRLPMLLVAAFGAWEVVKLSGISKVFEVRELSS